MTTYGVTMSIAVGVYIRELMGLYKMKPTQVAAAADVYVTYVNKVCRGEIEEPGLEKVRKLCKVVKGRWMDIWYLLNSEASKEDGKMLAGARYCSDNGISLTEPQRVILTKLLSDPEVAAAVVAALDARRGA